MIIKFCFIPDQLLVENNNIFGQRTTNLKYSYKCIVCSAYLNSWHDQFTWFCIKELNSV